MDTLDSGLRRNDAVGYRVCDTSISRVEFSGLRLSPYGSGMVWMNQNQLAKLFDTSVPNISMHISNILKDRELDGNSVVKEYLRTAADEKDIAELKQLEEKIEKTK